MIQIRNSQDRGRTQIDWLDSYHSFSFGDYHDPKNQGFRRLRVINEDFVEPGQGFAPHSHRDMEILTWILEGELKHQDSMGNGSVIRPGEIQRMSAGTGVTHSEYNSSDKNSVHLLQIWIFPEKTGLAPGYEQKAFTPAERKNKFCQLAGSKPAGNAVKIHQDAQLLVADLEAGKEVRYEIPAGRYAWVQVAKGSADLNGSKLSAGDGAAVSQEKLLTFKAKENSEILLFDLA